MGQYNDESLYVPSTFTELEQVLYTTYNKILKLNNLKEIDLDTFRLSNIKFSNQANLEVQRQLDVTIGGLYTMLGQYFLTKKEDLETKPKGSTPIGLNNALLALEGIDEVSIQEPNKDKNPTSDGTIQIVLNENNVSNFDIWNTIYQNRGIGITTLGDIEGTYVDNNNQFVTYKWNTINLIEDLQVKLYYQYSTNYQGNIITEESIKERYVQRFNDIAKIGNRLEPAYINDISFYPSLAYLDSEFSIDGGATFLDRNTILEVNFSDKYLIDKTSIVSITREV